ncbi:MAG: tRNA pseudouridine(55) synthase TruB [Anaerolineae bacterium]|nr:tRNA pseudouridine(55) synthase TruB [Anaerolineae bacterium]
MSLNSKGRELISGILNIDKPQGWTSHDVVARVRRLTGQRRVGHAGTLDPLATGVLLICLGQATRVAEYLMGGQKRYRATLRLGISTDTYDADGQVTRDVGPVDVSLEDVEAALSTFVGEIEQVPPLYSALKRDGQPLYRLARRGQAMEPQPRRVTIETVEIVHWASPELTLEIVCSPGTYVRSLAHDLGKRLGCGAHVTALRRLASGRFTAAEAISLDVLAEAAACGQWTSLLHPLEAALLDFEAVEVDAVEAQRLLHGQSIPCPKPPTTALGRAYDPAGHLIAIVAHDARGSVWRPGKVFGRTTNDE